MTRWKLPLLHQTCEFVYRFFPKPGPVSHLEAVQSDHSSPTNQTLKAPMSKNNVCQLFIHTSYILVTRPLYNNYTHFSNFFIGVQVLVSGSGLI